MAELFANPWDLAFTGAGANYITLGADLSASATTASFTFPSGFSLTAPSGSDFYRLIIDGEILTWTAGTVTAGATVSGQTVTRGQEGTIQNPHSAGRPVMPHWTAASLAALQSSIGATWGSTTTTAPANGTAGALPANPDGYTQTTLADGLTVVWMPYWLVPTGGASYPATPADFIPDVTIIGTMS